MTGEIDGVLLRSKLAGEMPDSEPSLIRTVVEGGVLMGPFLLLLLIWICTTLRYFLRCGRTLKQLVALLVFPLGFGLLGFAQWSLQWHGVHQAMAISGYPDEVQYIEKAVRIGRTTLVVLSTAGISLLSAAVAFAFPLHDPNQVRPASPNRL